MASMRDRSRESEVDAVGEVDRATGATPRLKFEKSAVRS